MPLPSRNIKTYDATCGDGLLIDVLQEMKIYKENYCRDLQQLSLELKLAQEYAKEAQQKSDKFEEDLSNQHALMESLEKKLSLARHNLQGVEASYECKLKSLADDHAKVALMLYCSCPFL